MKPPLEIVKGRITDYDERTGELLIRASYPDWATMIKREFKSCLVQLIDSRPLSDKQRRACYALIGEIADFTGEGKDPTVGDYLYHCLLAKKCCITGRPAQLHHIDRVGAGRDRTDIVHEGMEVLPLSPEMHQLAHTMPDSEFFERYHLPGGITLDKTLCKVWHLKRRKDNGKPAVDQERSG